MRDSLLCHFSAQKLLFLNYGIHHCAFKCAWLSWTYWSSLGLVQYDLTDDSKILQWCKLLGGKAVMETNPERKEFFSESQTNGVDN